MSAFWVGLIFAYLRFFDCLHPDEHRGLHHVWRSFRKQTGQRFPQPRGKMMLLSTIFWVLFYSQFVICWCEKFEVPVRNKHDRRPARMLHLTLNKKKSHTTFVIYLVELSKMFPIMSEPEKSIILLKVIKRFIWSPVDNNNKNKTCTPSVFVCHWQMFCLLCLRALWCPRPPLWCYLLCPGLPPMQWLVSCRTN